MFHGVLQHFPNSFKFHPTFDLEGWPTTFLFSGFLNPPFHFGTFLLFFVCVCEEGGGT